MSAPFFPEKDAMRELKEKEFFENAISVQYLKKNLSSLS